MGAGGKVVFGWNRMVFRGDGGDLSVPTAGGGGEGSSTIERHKQIPSACPPPFTSSKKHSS